MAAQLTLAVGQHDTPTFDNYRITTANRLTVNSLRQSVQDAGWHFTYLWGGAGSGRTHLLLAANALAGGVYLPLRDLQHSVPSSALLDLEFNGLVLLDDLHLVIGDDGWERAIFDLFNRCLWQECALVVSADRAAASLSTRLPDLQSRLNSGLSLHVREPDDDDKSLILRDRAAARGMRLSEEAAKFILARAGRDLGSLMHVLERLETASLQEKKPLSLPFLKRVLGI